jgi:hypothetical protein
MSGCNGQSKAKQMDAVQDVAGTQDEKATMQEGKIDSTSVTSHIRRASSGSIAKKDGGEVRFILFNALMLLINCFIISCQAMPPRPKTFAVRKIRDKGTARELRKQLNDYLASMDKADKAVYAWEMRVEEIDEEMRKLQDSSEK